MHQIANPSITSRPSRLQSCSSRLVPMFYYIQVHNIWCKTNKLHAAIYRNWCVMDCSLIMLFMMTTTSHAIHIRIYVYTRTPPRMSNTCDGIPTTLTSANTNMIIYRCMISQSTNKLHAAIYRNWCAMACSLIMLCMMTTTSHVIHIRTYVYTRTTQRMSNTCDGIHNTLTSANTNMIIYRCVISHMYIYTESGTVV